MPLPFAKAAIFPRSALASASPGAAAGNAATTQCQSSAFVASPSSWASLFANRPANGYCLAAGRFERCAFACASAKDLSSSARDLGSSEAGVLPISERMAALRAESSSAVTALTFSTTSLSRSCLFCRAVASSPAPRALPARFTSTRLAAKSLATAERTTTSGHPNSFLVKLAVRLPAPSPATVTTPAEESSPMRASTVSQYSGSDIPLWMAIACWKTSLSV